MGEKVTTPQLPPMSMCMLVMIFSGLLCFFWGCGGGGGGGMIGVYLTCVILYIPKLPN